MAYGLWQMRSGQATAIRIREDGGDTETDIGFDSFGEVDAATIAAHCGANEGFIVTWYDQTGNGRHWTAEDNAHQWRIYDGSALLTDSGTGETVASPTIDGSYNYTIQEGTVSAPGLSDVSIVFRHKETGNPNMAGVLANDNIDAIAAVHTAASNNKLYSRINSTSYSDVSVLCNTYAWYAATADRDDVLLQYKDSVASGTGTDITAQSAYSITASTQFLGRGPVNLGGTFRCAALYHRLLSNDEVQHWHAY